MNDNVAVGGRFDVVFSFYTGAAGVSAMNADREATVAIRIKSWRGIYEPAGTIDGQPVEILAIGKSPVAGYTRVTVRYPQPEADPAPEPEPE